MRFVWLGLVLSGCARTGMGVYASQVPDGERWCGEPQQITVPSRCSSTQAGTGEELVPQSVVTNCVWHLESDPVMTDGNFIGVMDLELEFGADGRVSGLCLVGSNYGDQLDYTRCVMNEIRAAVRHESNSRIPYRLTYCLR